MGIEMEIEIEIDIEIEVETSTNIEMEIDSDIFFTHLFSLMETVDRGTRGPEDQTVGGLGDRGTAGPLPNLPQKKTTMGPTRPLAFMSDVDVALHAARKVSERSNYHIKLCKRGKLQTRRLPTGIGQVCPRLCDFTPLFGSAQWTRRDFSSVGITISLLVQDRANSLMHVQRPLNASNGSGRSGREP